MYAFIRRIPIARRLFLTLALVTLVPAVIIVLLGGFYFDSLNTRDMAVRTSFDAQNLAAQQQINLQRMNALLQTRHMQIFANLYASLSGSKPDVSLGASGALVNIDILSRELDFQQALSQFHSSYEIATSDNMATIRNILISDNPGTGIIDEQKAALDNVTNVQWPRYLALQDSELNALQSLAGRTDLTPFQVNQAYESAYATLFNANAAFLDLRNSWQNVVDVAVATGKTVTSVGPSQINPVLISTTLALVGTILLVFLIGFVVNRTITQPLRRLAMLTRHIIKGDTSARVKPDGHDEISLVSVSVNNMLDNIVRLIQDARARHDSLQTQVEKLVREVSGIAEGDLRQQAEVTVDALGVLADSFNYMIEELSGLIVRVKKLSFEVKTSTAMTFDRMTHLVASADEQINRIAAAATDVRSVADSSREVATRAQVLFSSAVQARQTAQHGRQAVEMAVEGMGRVQENVQNTTERVQALGERSQEINNIVQVISTIAFQTNRLALDAAVQAATAGENGKGFAAVAADIRRLAEVAKDQAGKIARIARGVQEEMGAVASSMQETKRETLAGSQLTQEAGNALESIVVAVEGQAREIESINQVTERQVQTSDGVVQVMQNVSQMTRQSSASTRQVSQLMERLAWLADQLLVSVGAFKLREEQNNYQAQITQPGPGRQSQRLDSQGSISGFFRALNGSAHTPQLPNRRPMHNPSGPLQQQERTPLYPKQ